MEEIVKKFGENDSQLTGWISDYKSEVAGFKAVTKIADYIEACSDEEDVADSEQSIRQNIAQYDKRYCRKLSIKLKARITHKSLDYIDEFWRSIVASSAGHHQRGVCGGDLACPNSASLTDRGQHGGL